MRFEVAAAFVIGALLPLLETLRRGIGHWRVSVSTMFEDYFAGALLLGAGWLAVRSSASAPAMLVAAWGYCTGMMSTSFWSQLEMTLRGTAREDGNEIVVAFKLALWSTCAAGLVLSLRRLPRERTAPAP